MGMNSVKVCGACRGEATSSDGRRPCAVCQGVGAKIPMLSPVALNTAPAKEIASLVRRSFAEMAMTRCLPPRVAIALFLAGLARYQDPKARDLTLTQLRCVGMALIANATEASLLLAEQDALRAA